MYKLFLLLLLLLSFAFLFLYNTKVLNRVYAMALCFLLALLALPMYYYWGGIPAVKELLLQTEKKERLNKALSEYKNSDEVIKKIEAHLQKEPNSAKGWYLLGRLYASKKEFTKAYQAFAHAYQLNPQNDRVALNYLQAKYFIDGRQFDTNSKQLVDELLKKSTYQPELLNFLALDAYTHQRYDKAIDYWQRLLGLLPKGSDSYKHILQAMAKAEKKRSNLT